MNAFKTFVDRRAFLKGTACATAAVIYGRSPAIAKIHSDDALLDDLSKRCFQYFWDAIDPETGICKDLIHSDPNDNAKKGDESRGSTGVTGFRLQHREPSPRTLPVLEPFWRVPLRFSLLIQGWRHVLRPPVL